MSTFGSNLSRVKLELGGSSNIDQKVHSANQLQEVGPTAKRGFLRCRCDHNGLLNQDQLVLPTDDRQICYWDLLW